MAKQWNINAVPGVLEQLYKQVLERDVDPVGQIFFGCQLVRGELSVRDVVRDVGLSQEYTARFITPDTVQNAVQLCYQHFLARPADPGGLAAWEQVAQTQGWQAVIIGLVNSAEYTTRFGDDVVPHA